MNKLFPLLLAFAICACSVTDDNKPTPSPESLKAVVLGKDGNLRYVDRQGNAVVVSKSNQVLGQEKYEIKQMPDGTKYFEFEGEKYHAEPK